MIVLLVLGGGAGGLAVSLGRTGGLMVGFDDASNESDPSRSWIDDLLQTYPGLVRPPAVPPSRAGLNDDEPVIGLVMAGIARAYPIRLMNEPHQHVINDVIGTVPVSVTYCNIENCARAFTGEGDGTPLDLAVGGQHRARGLLLLADGERYYQATQEPYMPGRAARPFPYQGVPLTVTTWKAWLSAHPDTQVSLPPAGSAVRPAPRGASTVHQSR